MSDVTVKLRENGPILISGKITLEDHQGQKFNLDGKETIALCRCAQSQKRPFCDGSHKSCGFVAQDLAQ